MSQKSQPQHYKAHNLISISRSRLLHNFDLLQAQSGGLEMIPVLKSNAYGHGIEQVAEILKDRKFPYIAVDSYHEYRRVRAVSQQPVLIIGALDCAQIPDLEFDGTAVFVQDKATVEALSKAGQPINIHLDVDTGMNRYGARLDEVEELLEAIARHDSLQLAGVASHFADADNPDDAFSQSQAERFDSVVERVRARGFDPLWVHVANSAGTIKQFSKHANACRPGLALYGLNPLEGSDTHAETFGELQPALQFSSRIVRVRQVSAGESVGYSRTYVAREDMRIGAIPLGYYEGLPRALSSKAVLLSEDGHQLPVVGTVGMNHVMVDLGESGLDEGDIVVVMSAEKSAGNSVQSLADQSEMLNYEFLVHLSESTQRVVVD